MQPSHQKPGLKRALSFPSPPSSPIREEGLRQSKRPKLDPSCFQTPQTTSDTSIAPIAPIQASRSLLAMDTTEDPFAAPKDGRVIAGQGHTRLPQGDTMTYVFKGKKVRAPRPRGQDDSEDELMASIKPKLLFPSPLPPAPPVDRTPIRTPQKPKKAGPYIPPTPESLPRGAAWRARKISNDVHVYSDPFGGDTKWQRDCSLARRAGGSSSGMLWEGS